MGNTEYEYPSQTEFFAEVNPVDLDIIQDLCRIKGFNGKLITIPSARNELGRSPHYSAGDKCIRLTDSTADSRTYGIPYTEFARNARAYEIYTYPLTVFDDGSFQIGDGKIRTLGSVSDSTLSNDVYKAKTSWLR